MLNKIKKQIRKGKNKMCIFLTIVSGFIGGSCGAYVANRGIARCHAALYDRNKE